MKRRLAALAALVLGLVAAGLMIALAAVDVPRGALGIAVIVLAAVATWYGLVRRSAVHPAGIALAALFAVTVCVLLIVADPALALGIVVALALAVTAARYAFQVRVRLAPAARPRHPVVFWNPSSGNGKALRFHLADEARARGIEPIELRPGMKLEQLVLGSLDAGADALAMAGGDGSQAIVARIAADRGVPYACIPAGTRNHFALDLGVDRDDVVGALDAFVDGGERQVDLGDVNGRTFVNNVSLGVYGEAVQRSGYRAAKLRTIAETLPEVVGPQAPANLHWRDPGGTAHEGAAAIVLSNNPYRIGRGIGDGTRPRLDTGAVGVVVLGEPGDETGVRTWAAPEVDIDAPGPVPAGVDGEAVLLDAPVHCRVRRAALRCRIARSHPGASPSAYAPGGLRDALRTLFGLARGHDPRPLPA
jgi:diacylglycerol kinase family enzyme